MSGKCVKTPDVVIKHTFTSNLLLTSDHILVFMLKNCVLLIWVVYVKEVPGIEAGIARPHATLSAQEINSPPGIHVVDIGSVSDDQVTHALAVVLISVPGILNHRRLCSRVSIGALGVLSAMEEESFAWSVERVSCGPVGVGHPELFPSKHSVMFATVSSSLQQVSVAESEVAGGVHSLERPCQLVCVLVDITAVPVGHAVFVPPLLSEHQGWAILEIGSAHGVSRVLHLELSKVASEHRFGSCITTVELGECTDIPAFACTVAAVKLQLVRLALVVLLDSVSGAVGILELSVWHCLHDDR